MFGKEQFPSPDAQESFRDLIHGLSDRPRLYTPNGTYDEVVQYIDVYSRGAGYPYGFWDMESGMEAFKRWLFRTKRGVEDVYADQRHWRIAYLDYFNGDAEQALAELGPLYEEYLHETQDCESPRQAFENYVAAANAHDLEATLEHIDDDAVFLFSNESHHIGRPAVRDAVAHNFAAIRHESYRVSHVRWLAETNNLAVCIYEFDWSGEVDGQSVCGAGRGTCVLKSTYGDWRIVHEHLSRGSLGGRTAS